jgi:hypothetical protein
MAEYYDQTFDIAIEYLQKLKLTPADWNDALQHTIKDEQQRQERVKKMEQEEAEFEKHRQEGEEEVGFEENMILSYKELKKQQAEREKNAPPVLVKIRKMIVKYYKDKRLFYANEHYYGAVMQVAIYDLIERNYFNENVAWDKPKTVGGTSFELACAVMNENQHIIDGGVYEKCGNSIYPQFAFNEFKKRVADMPDCFIWSKDEESLFQIFSIAFHYNQKISQEQIDSQPKNVSRVERFFRAKGFFAFYLPYCIIPYLVQEALLIILVLSRKGITQIDILNFVGEIRVWVEKNYVNYISTMLFIATLINYYIIKTVFYD